MLRARLRRGSGIAAVLVAAALGLSPAAMAQGGSPTSPLAPGLPVTPGSTPTTTTAPTISTALTPTSTSGGGLSGSAAVAIGVGALIVLGGISFFIWWDARRRAPVRGRAAAATAGGAPGSRQRPKPRKLSPAERKRRKRGRAK